MDMQFPSSFKFGVADADLQVIGERNTIQKEKSERTMWSYFAKTSGKCHNNEGPEEGVDRYHRWKEDIAIMKRMGVRHYRTSLSMSRILKRNGEVNSLAVKWYSNYFKTLKQNGIAIYATLYHWELPLYLHEIGGWKNPKTIDVFVKHARTVAEYLGEYISEYFILNEPWCASMLSYHQGAHAPGETNLVGALLAAHHLLLAQGVAFRTMKTIDSNLKIGTVVNTEPAYAYSADPKDIEAARRANGYFNLWFWDPLFLGKYPEHMVDVYGKAMPTIKKSDMDVMQIGSQLYALGTNYYCGDIARFDPKAPIWHPGYVYKEGQTNDLGWPIFLPPLYPEGLFDMLQQVYYSYKNHGLKRIYITENGMALRSDWDGKSTIVNDDRRVQYYREHLKQIHKAIRRGIPVEGYFAWTLMDNYEWAEGYRPEACFGMIHVDHRTLKRVWKKSARWYQKLIQSSIIPQEP